MKITFDRTTKRYVVSQNGLIQALTCTLHDAMRLAGIEPEPEYLEGVRSVVQGDSVSFDDELSLESLLDGLGILEG